MPLFLLVVAVATAAVCAAELFGVGYRRTARRRREQGFRTLRQALKDGSVHADVLYATQRYFDLVTGVVDFPVWPDDNLLAVYGLHVEDARDAVVAIAAAADCLVTEQLDEAMGEGVATPRDLALAVQRLHAAAVGAVGAVPGRPTLLRDVG